MDSPKMATVNSSGNGRRISPAVTRQSDQHSGEVEAKDQHVNTIGRSPNTQHRKHQPELVPSQRRGAQHRSNGGDLDVGNQQVNTIKRSPNTAEHRRQQPEFGPGQSAQHSEKLEGRNQQVNTIERYPNARNRKQQLELGPSQRQSGQHNGSDGEVEGKIQQINTTKRSPNTDEHRKQHHDLGPSQRRKRLARQGTLTFEDCEKAATARSVVVVADGSVCAAAQAPQKVSPKSQPPPNNLRVPANEIADPTRMRTTTGSSGIYGVPDNVISPVADQGSAHGVQQAKDEVKPIRNYRIKSIRRGVPEIVTAGAPALQIATRDIEVSKLCVCKRGGEKEHRSATAWAFSVFVTSVCVICPLLSFTSDVVFFVLCSDHYNHTETLLADQRAASFPSAFVTQHDVITHDVNVAQVRGARPAPLLHHDIHQITAQAHHSHRHMGKRSIYDRLLLGDDVKKKKSCAESGDVILSPAPRRRVAAPESDPDNLTLVDPNDRKLCRNISEVLDFMKTDEAARRLEAHRRVTIEVFEPVFIIGSFPSLLFSIFTRLVVMVTWHDHFISAYVINMAVMPLELVTGALGVHTASYHMGDLGFACWECAVEGDCSNLGYDQWMDDEVNKSLVVALVTKLVDGIAGGVVIFVVLTRILWRDHGHVTFWWYGTRSLLCVISLILCTTVSGLLVITPAVGVVRLEVMAKLPEFEGKERLSFITTILLVMGFTAWSVSLSTLFIYLVYRSYVYCRLREHVTGIQEVDL